jgi:hypothetical protein
MGFWIVITLLLVALLATLVLVSAARLSARAIGEDPLLAETSDEVSLDEAEEQPAVEGVATRPASVSTN